MMARGEVSVKPDIPYYTGDDAVPAKQALDLYLPDGDPPEGGWPVFLFVHGGGWTSGDRRYLGELYGNVGQAVAREGIVGVVISYRLAPAVQYEAQALDVARAVAWTQAHIAEHGGDPARLVIGGHSAGGHLSALVALDRSYLAAAGGDADGIRGVAGMSGVYDVAAMARVQALRGLIRPAFGDDPEVWRAASPITHLRADAPPFWLNNAELDWGLQRPAEQFEQALRQAGVEVSRSITPETNHLTVVARMGAEGDLTTTRLTEFVGRVTANR